MTGLVEQDGLQADQLQHGEEHADEGALGVGVVEQPAQADGLVFHEQAAFDVVDHLGDGDGLLVDVEDGALAEAVEDVLEDADEVDGVGGDLLIETRVRLRRLPERRGGSSSCRGWSRWPLRSAASGGASGRRP